MSLVLLRQFDSEMLDKQQIQMKKLIILCDNPIGFRETIDGTSHLGTNSEHLQTINNLPSLRKSKRKYRDSNLKQTRKVGIKLTRMHD